MTNFLLEALGALPFEWARFHFMRNAFLAVLLITPLFGLLGTMVVNNKMSFFSDALGHSALTGIAIGVILGIDNYMLSMLGFSLLFALAISAIIESGNASSDTIIGVFSSCGIAVGIVLLSKNGGFSKYSNYLIGDILSIHQSEIASLFFILLLILLIWAISFNKILLASVNADLAASKGISISFYKNVFMVLVALVVTISIRWVGILIINSLLVLPAAASRNIAKNMKAYHLISVCFSLISGVTGLVLSYYWGTSAGGTIVLVAAAVFFIAFLYGISPKIRIKP